LPAAGNPAGANLTTNNYGGAGALAIGAASSTKGEFDSVIKFNTASEGQEKCSSIISSLL
jgi:hypothetical protein